MYIHDVYNARADRVDTYRVKTHRVRYTVTVQTLIKLPSTPPVQYYSTVSRFEAVYKLAQKDIVGGLLYCKVLEAN